MKHKIFDKYLADILKVFRIEEKDFFSPTKNRDIVDAKQLLYYMCSRRQMRPSSIKEMMSKAGVNYNYDIHKVNILRGIKNAQKLVDSDDDFFKVMKRIEDSTFI
jgi:hypothetical protein